MKKIYTLVFAFCFCTAAHGQNTFEKVIDTLNAGYANCVKETMDGGYILCGGTNNFNNDAVVIKLDSTGTIEWAKTYNGPGTDAAYYIEQLPDSGYIVDGGYDLGVNGKNWLLRLDKNGDTLWTKILSAGIGGTFPYQLIVSSNYNYGLTGYFNSASLSKSEAYLIIADSIGTANPVKIYNTTFGSKAFSICRYNTNYVFTGAFLPTTGTVDLYLVCTDSIGDTLWTKTYDNSQTDVGFTVQQTIDSGFIVAGFTWNNISFNSNLFLVKTDNVGDKLWSKQYGDTLSCTAYSCAQTNDSGYIITGRIVTGTPLTSNVYLVKTDFKGDTLWTRQFGNSSEDDGYYVTETKDGGYIISGETESFGPRAIYLIKTDSAGNVATPMSWPEIDDPYHAIVFPNPNWGVFTLKVSGLKKRDYTYDIFNLYGINVRSGKLAQPVDGNSVTEINLKDLPHNLFYTLVINDKKNRFVTKTIVNR